MNKVFAKEWENTLYHVGAFFFESLASQWLVFSDKLCRLGETEQNDIENKISELNHEIDVLVDTKQTLRDIASKLSAKAEKAYNDYVKAEIDFNLVKAYHIYLQKKENGQEIDATTQKSVEKYFDMVKNRSDKESLFRELRKKADEAAAEQQKYIRDNDGKTKRYAYELKQYERILNTHFCIDKNAIASDKKVVYDLLKSENSKNAFVIYLKDIIKKTTGSDFYFTLSDGEREKCVELFYSYVVNLEYEMFDFIACGYDKTVSENQTIIKGRYPDETFVFKIINGFYTSLMAYFKKSYEEVRNEHFNKDSVDVAYMDGDGDEFASGYDKLNYLNSNTTEKYNSSSWIGRHINKNRLMDYSAQSHWMIIKKDLLSHSEKIAMSLYHILEKKVSNNVAFWKNINKSMLKNAVEIIINRIGVELMSGRPVGKKMLHIVADAFGGFESVAVKNIIVKSVTSILETYISFYFLKRMEMIYGADNIDRGTLDEEIQKNCDAVRQCFENKVNNLKKYGGIEMGNKYDNCENLIYQLEQQVFESDDTEKRQKFLLKNRPMSPFPQVNTTVVKKI